MFFNKKRKREPDTNVQWVNLVVIGVIVLALISNVGKYLTGQSAPVVESVQQAAKDISPENLLPIEDYKTKLFPGQRGDIGLREIATGFRSSETCGPATPDIKSTPYRIIDNKRGGGPPLTCGATGKFNVTIWSLDGKKIYASKEPLQFIPGKSEVMMGLEQGVIGIQPNGTRTLIIPPAFQKTVGGAPSSLHFPLPDKQTVLVDIEALP